MKIVNNDIYNFTIFLNSFYTKKMNFNNKNDLQSTFENLFFKLKDNYGFDMNGFYTIDVYMDNFYGVILDIKNEDLDYFNYFKTSIDMQISKPIKGSFLYKVKDLFNLDKKILRSISIYKYRNNYYLKLLNKLNYIQIGKILEFSEITYGDKTKRIIEAGNLISMEA